MEIFNIVKCGDAYCNLADIPPLSYQAYCLEADDCILQFLHLLGISDLNTDSDLLKKKYNPLLIKQSLFLTTPHVCYEIPFLLFQHQRVLPDIAQYINNIEQEHQKSICVTLIKYIFTKDFSYLHELIASHANFNLSVFTFLNKAITVYDFYHFEFEKAIAVLQGLEPGMGSIYGEYLNRKNYLEHTNTIYNKIKSEPVKKNVILIHLESLSNEIYYNQLHNFPFLRELINRSLLLNHYFSSATSSCMSLIDLFFGNDFESDRFPVFDEMYLTDLYQKNMYEVLQENGYDVLGIGLKETKTEEINSFNLWTVANQNYEWKDYYSDFTERIHDFICQAERPFAMHIWNLMTHLGHNDTDTYKGSTCVERMDISYVSLDMTIKTVMDALDEKGILDDTVIIGYGDHGDDKWTRALNYGCTHIVAPHLNVIHTPAFIFDKRIGVGLYNNLVSTVDIKNTALFLAGITHKEDFEPCGINIFEKKNEIVYSRSLLTNQQEYATLSAEWVIRLNNFSPTEHKNKSFSAINQQYNLLVGKNGIEFYMHRNDPGSYNNLLHFFELDVDGNIVKFNNHGAWRGHFRTLLMADDQIFDILRNYDTLKKALIERIQLKNSFINASEKNFFHMNLFKKTSPRGFIW